MVARLYALTQQWETLQFGGLSVCFVVVAVVVVAEREGESPGSL